MDHERHEECAAQEQDDHGAGRCRRVVGDDETCDACYDRKDDAPEMIGARVA